MRNAESQPFVIDRRTGMPAPWDGKGVQPDLGAVWQGHRTVFQHHGRALPRARLCARGGGGAGAGSRRGASARWPPNWPRVAFDQAIVIDQPWTDFRGDHHATMPGRPVSFHAMRGISAHSNGFQTARALHLLQILLGRGGNARRLPAEAALSEADRGASDAAFRGDARQAAVRAASGLCARARTTGAAARRQPARIDKAFSWENPFSAHGMMHMVIPNAHAGDPYRIDTLFLYMANMAWNSSMNTAARDGDADRQGRGRRIRHPPDHLFRRLCVARWWPMPT